MSWREHGEREVMEWLVSDSQEESSESAMESWGEERAPFEGGLTYLLSPPVPLGNENSLRTRISEALLGGVSPRQLGQPWLHWVDEASDSGAGKEANDGVIAGATPQPVEDFGLTQYVMGRQPRDSEAARFARRLLSGDPCAADEFSESVRARRREVVLPAVFALRNLSRHMDARVEVGSLAFRLLREMMEGDAGAFEPSIAGALLSVVAVHRRMSLSGSVALLVRETMLAQAVFEAMLGLEGLIPRK